MISLYVRVIYCIDHYGNYLLNQSPLFEYETILNFLVSLYAPYSLANSKLKSKVSIQYIKVLLTRIPAGDYMFKVKNRNNRTRCEIRSKLTIKTPERLWTCNCRLGYNEWYKVSFAISSLKFHQTSENNFCYL